MSSLTIPHIVHIPVFPRYMLSIASFPGCVGMRLMWSMAAHSTNHITADITDIIDIRKHFCLNTPISVPAME